MISKYDVGQTVWILENKGDVVNTHVKCSFCNGTGKLNTHHGEIDCNAHADNMWCTRGEIYVWGKALTPTKTKVSSIFVSETGLEYGLGISFLGVYREHELFASEEEAVAFANRRGADENKV